MPHAASGGVAVDHGGYTKPVALPTPPEDVSLLPVLGYIVELVRTEGQNGWRLVAALIAMTASKAMGTKTSARMGNVVLRYIYTGRLCCLQCACVISN